MQQLEVFFFARSLVAVQWIFVAFAQKAEVVGAFQLFNPGGIAPEFLIITLDRPRILHSAMDHFLFAIALDLKFQIADDRQRSD